MKRNELLVHLIVNAAILAVVVLAVPAVGTAQQKEVVVINGVATPVPVHVQGTPGVNVVKGPALEAVQKTMFTSFPVDVRFTDRVVLYTVPAGKRLVIDSVSIMANLAGPDQRLVHVLFEVDNGDVVPYVISVQPVAEGLFLSTGANIFRKTESITAYAAPGTEVVARGTRDGSDLAHLDSLGVGFAGHLVDAP